LDPPISCFSASFSTELNVQFLCFSVGQVAFSASLLTSGAGHTGPFNAFTPLVFRHVISNIGNAYSPTTGFFIAPVRGAYHFEFYIAALGSTHNSGAGLLKNGEHVVIAYETEAKSWGQSANGATLLLEANDIVSLRLWANTRIYENTNRHNTFSGRLLACFFTGENWSSQV
uniref:C1q domain-containing protein n=1 Tax=Neogobius melanostomus TaxID=47308 RepID=A0A8C6SKK2_9GOBI